MKKLSELLPLYEIYEENYVKQINDGITILQNSNITILSLVRNVENVLEKNIDLLVSFFTKYEANVNILLYENDSVDDTKNILEKLKEKYSDKLTFISENLDRPHYGTVKDENRIKALSEYRNKLKEIAQQKAPGDFVIVLDMDFDDISLSGLLNSFGYLRNNPVISAVAGNSFEYKKGLDSRNPDIYNMWNYDCWAFRQTWWLDNEVFPPAPNNNLAPMFWFGLFIPPTGSGIFSVNSAFGGCCIYRSDIYFKGNYDYKDCEHVCFHYSLAKDTSNNFRLVLNPSQQMVFVK